MKALWGSGGIAPHILGLGTIWGRVISFTPRPLYSQRKSPWYPFDRKLGGPQSNLLPAICQGEFCCHKQKELSTTCPQSMWKIFEWIMEILKSKEIKRVIKHKRVYYSLPQ
jgi:hypothetical protein